jgi:hypothetical protein
VRETEPEIQYARSGEVHIAYTVTGDGPLDLVLVEGYFTHLGIMWAEPRGVVGFEVILDAYSPLSMAATSPVSRSGYSSAMEASDR